MEHQGCVHCSALRARLQPEHAAAMIVCQCLATNEATIRYFATNGAATVADIGRACGAGTDCGSCLAMITAVLSQCHAVELDPQHHTVRSIAFDPIAAGA
ncbi:MAG: (2Fe-2S)-binding protein [Acidimicrobiaceae bacterium]|nr:(2Fe-2S)-binding protein [Acidimicrobiaceae bacterium]MDE0498463.1 (2Fe-2S)-binding protein [Acidimicrobiaceae bacterium]